MPPHAYLVCGVQLFTSIASEFRDDFMMIVTRPYFSYAEA